jgi:Domain of unknown function (DUF4375)
MRFAVVLAVGLGVAQAAAAGPCAPGAQVDYPLSAVLEDEARSYLIDAIIRDDVPPDADPLLPYATAYVVVLAERSAALPEGLRDLPYMIALAEVAGYPDPAYSLTQSVQARPLPLLADAAERQGLVAEAGLLRALVQPVLGSGVSSGMTTDEIGSALHAAAPKIRAVTEAMVTGDPALAAAYEARRLGVDDETRVNHLIGRLVTECLADWWTPAEADAAFAGMGQAQAEILLLHMFLAESFNGSTHQYFFNSSGTMAPQLADLLERIGLRDHAAGVRAGMAMFPTPYPRDTDARRNVMAGFTEAEDEALYALTVWADDGMILEAMAELVEAAGLMPR